MKKICILLLVLLMICGCASAYELGTRLVVDHCKEYITLRETPSTKAAALDRIELGVDSVVLLSENYDDFAEISYDGQRGYALKEYLEPAEEFSGEKYTLGKRERYSVNHFLTKFSEQYFAVRQGSYHAGSGDEMLVDFGINHLWFNGGELVEEGAWGEYNVRVRVGDVNSAIEQYLGRLPAQAERQGYLLSEGYYYWQETGGHVNDGFAVLDRIEQLDDHRYSVYFSVFDAGEAWAQDVHDLSYSEAEQGHWRYYDGHAVIDVGSGNLLKSDAWTLERYAVIAAE